MSSDRTAGHSLRRLALALATLLFIPLLAAASASNDDSEVAGDLADATVPRPDAHTPQEAGTLPRRAPSLVPEAGGVPDVLTPRMLRDAASLRPQRRPEPL
jgi:hypothetical protein